MTPLMLSRFRTMPAVPLFFLILVWLGLYSSSACAQSEQNRATHLGNPATRFADPLKTPDDFRRVFLRESLQADINKILRMSDYLGDPKDFRDAVTRAELKQISIPVGTLLPAMSTRRKGEPVLLRNVLWAGKKPFDAYEFSFISLDRRYRVIVPKACSNFWVEEQLPRPVPTLALTCSTPAESPIQKAITVCNHLSNQGEVTEALAMLSMQTPANLRLDSSTDEGVQEEDGDITWTLANLAPGETRTRCATFTPQQRGPLSFRSAATGKRSNDVSTQCESQVIGVPAVLLEVIDLADPVLVGNEVTYVIRVLNQGTLPLTQVKVVARMEEGQSYVSGSGATEVVVLGDLVGPGVVPLLNPQESVEWRIVVKAEQAGDLRFNVGLHADQFSRVILETEATFQY